MTVEAADARSSCPQCKAVFRGGFLRCPRDGSLLSSAVEDPLVGSVLVILAVAAGLTDYLVFAEIPAALVAWTQEHVHSKLMFLLFLNLFLLIVGTLMDIFSAIVVVVPLIMPLAEVYDVNPVHLGIIFVANLELGFLHPPLGLNLLLASVRFKKPVLEVTWATLPMLGILAVGVLLITYVPWLTLGILQWMGRVP